LRSSSSVKFLILSTFIRFLDSSQLLHSDLPDGSKLIADSFF
jgi:hypothetical protein